VNTKIDTSETKNVLVGTFDKEDWIELFKREPNGYSWREEAYLAGEDYFEEGKEFLRSN
jgi:hypothetical protein